MCKLRLEIIFADIPKLIIILIFRITKKYQLTLINMNNHTSLLVNGLSAHSTSTPVPGNTCCRYKIYKYFLVIRYKKIYISFKLFNVHDTPIRFFPIT